jgi:NAD(P)-dependent dehydrogenase (short-subunit alcohol dehydrogenase family)
MGDRRMFAVDLVGSVLVVDAFEPMIAADGVAVVFASMAAHNVSADADGTVDAILDDPLADGATARFVDATLVNKDPGRAYAFAKRESRASSGAAPCRRARGARINSISSGSIATPMGRPELADQSRIATCWSKHRSDASTTPTRSRASPRSCSPTPPPT